MAQENDIQFNAGDFERYYSGRMTEQEMYALEKAAMEDPFLADAFEGYVYTPTPVQDIQELKDRLQKKKKSKLVLFSGSATSQFMKAAAILILVAGFSWVIYKKNADQPANRLIAVKDAVIQSPGTVEMETSILQTDSLTTSATYKAAPARDQWAGILHKQDTTGDGTVAIGSVQQEYQTAESKYQEAAKEESDAEKRSVNKETFSTIPGVQVKDAIVQGRVLDDAGQPVPFAVVMEKGKNAGVVADQSGNFNYAVKDTAQLVVNASGYESRTLDVNTAAQLQDIVLQNHRNSPREAIVVNAMGKKSKASSAAMQNVVLLPNIAVKNAAPLNGWDALNRFLQDSLSRTNTNVPKGNVIVSFDVSKTGEASPIKIKKTGGAFFDEQAIRAVSNQRWKLTNPRKKAEATVNF